MTRSEIDRLDSGNPRLDAILRGGLPTNAINLLIGPPGAGKTIFADQYLFHNATDDRPAIYYSTLSEPHEKLLRYGQSLSVFDTEAVGRRVFYEALGPLVRAGGLGAVAERVSEDIKARRPGVIAIDSFRALSSYADARQFRTFLADLADCLTAFPASAFWVGEYSPEDIADAPEFAVADSIVSLSREDRGVREFRYLQVLKLRDPASCRASMPAVSPATASTSSPVWPTRVTRPPTRPASDAPRPASRPSMR